MTFNAPLQSKSYKILYNRIPQNCMKMPHCNPRPVISLTNTTLHGCMSNMGLPVMHKYGAMLLWLGPYNLMT